MDVVAFAQEALLQQLLQQNRPFKLPPELPRPKAAAEAGEAAEGAEAETRCAVEERASKEGHLLKALVQHLFFKRNRYHGSPFVASLDSRCGGKSSAFPFIESGGGSLRNTSPRVLLSTHLPGGFATTDQTVLFQYPPGSPDGGEHGEARLGLYLGNYRIRFDFAGSASGISVWDQILIGRISVVGSDSSGTVGMVGRDGRDSPCTAS